MIESEKTRKYQVPEALTRLVEQRAYDRWLEHKAAAHVKRDRKRRNASVKIEAYKRAIHSAVALSAGRDAYTGEKLRWDLISKYDNAASKLGRRAYKAKFAHLPTVDHIGNGLGAAKFKICGWCVNDAKNDLSYGEFVKLCRRVVEHHAKKTKP